MKNSSIRTIGAMGLLFIVVIFAPQISRFIHEEQEETVRNRRTVVLREAYHRQMLRCTVGEIKGNQAELIIGHEVYVVTLVVDPTKGWFETGDLIRVEAKVSPIYVYQDGIEGKPTTVGLNIDELYAYSAKLIMKGGEKDE